MKNVTVIHTETGNTVGSFESRELAQTWIDSYGASQEYKDRCYRIEVPEPAPVKAAILFFTREDVR